MLEKLFRFRSRLVGDTPPVSQRRSYDSAPIISRNLPVEILAENGSTLLTGKLLSFNLARVTVERIPGTFTLPALPAGKEVTVQGYDDDLEPVHFAARVREFTVLRCQIVRVTMLEDNTFEYGLIFAQMDQRKYHELAVDIKMAREMIQKNSIAKARRPSHCGGGCLFLSCRGQEDPGLLRLAKSRLRRLLACMGLRALSCGECQRFQQHWRARIASQQPLPQCSAPLSPSARPISSTS